MHLECTLYQQMPVIQSHVCQMDIANCFNKLFIWCFIFVQNLQHQYIMCIAKFMIYTVSIGQHSLVDTNHQMKSILSFLHTISVRANKLTYSDGTVNRISVFSFQFQIIVSTQQYQKQMGENCMSGWIVTICACLLAIVSVSATLYWVVRSIQIQNAMTTSNSYSKFNKKLLMVNGSSIIVFTVVSVIIAIHCVIRLFQCYNSSTNIDFINDFESSNIQLTLTLSAFFYLIGKLLVYIVLYLRLHYALKESLFAYTDAFYTKLKIIISICIISALLSFVSASFGFLIGALICTVVYAILDIVIPIRLNILFINKLHEICNFMINLRASKSQMQLELQPETNKKAGNDKVQQQHKQQQTVQKLQIASQSGQTSEDDTNIEQAQKKYENLLSVLSRFSTLGATVTISSLLYLLIVVITIMVSPQETNEDLLEANIGALIRWTLLSVDACINSICLMLYFEYTLSLYNIFCYSCNKTDCAKNCLVTFCLCNCGCCRCRG